MKSECLCMRLLCLSLFYGSIAQMQGAQDIPEPQQILQTK